MDDVDACALLEEADVIVPGTVLRPVDPVTLRCSPAGDPAVVVLNEAWGLGGGSCALGPATGGEGTRLGGDGGGKFVPPPPVPAAGKGGDCSVLTSRLIAVEVDLVVSPGRSSTRLVLRTDVNDAAISAPILGDGLENPLAPVAAGRDGTNPSSLVTLCILSDCACPCCC